MIDPLKPAVNPIKLKKERKRLWGSVVAFIVLNFLIFAFLPLFVSLLFHKYFAHFSGTLLIGTVAYAYLMAVPYFIALFMCLRIAGNIRSETVFSESSRSALRGISHCCAAEMALAAVGSALYAVFFRGPWTLILLFLVVVCGAGLLLASVFSEVVRSAIEIKRENELTI